MNAAAAAAAAVLWGLVSSNVNSEGGKGRSMYSSSFGNFKSAEQAGSSSVCSEKKRGGETTLEMANRRISE